MRSKSLDLAKYVYMIIICFWHTGWIDSLYKGYSPVEFFFISAGFFLYRSAIRGTSLIDYVKSRLQRLYPAFVISLLIYAILLKAPYNIMDFLYDATLIRDVIHIEGMNSLNRVIWFVPVLFWGGLLVMSALKATKKIVLFLLGAVFIYVNILMSCGNFNDTFRCVGIFYVPFWRGVAGLLLGVVIGSIATKVDKENISDCCIKWIGSVGILSFCLSIVLLFLPYDTEILSLCCYCAVMLSSIISDKIVRGWCPQLPDITYEMFLLHIIVIMFTVKFLDLLGWVQYSWLKYVTYVAILLFASYVLNRLVKYLRSLILKII